MTIHSWPWFIVAVGLTVLLVVGFFAWVYAVIEEDAREFIQAVIFIAVAVAILVGVVLLISYGFSYSLTGHS
jgi:hypothetical protein